MKEDMAQNDDDDKTHTSEHITTTHTDDATEPNTTEPTSDPDQSPSLEPAQSPFLGPAQSPSLEPAQSPSLEPAQSPSLEPAQSPSFESQSVVETPQTKSVGFSSDIDDSDDDECGDIDDDIDDALDEGYMGMECTLERGFSLNESAIAHDIRMEKYDEVAIKYQHTSSPSRYYPTFRHFKPLRKPPKNQHEMPVDKAGLYSFVMISWVTRLMWKAYKVGLKEEDLPLCSKYEMCDYNTDRLERLWHEEIKKKGKHKASLQHVLFKFYKTRVIFSSLLFAIMTILGIFGPVVFMRNLLVWLETEEPFAVGLYWAIGLILVEFARVILFCLVWSLNYRTGIRLRAACLGLLYRKLMRMSSLGNRSVGEIINLFANDSQRIFDFIVIGPMIIACPIVAVGGVIYILWLLGPWALFGMVAFVLFYPFQYILSRLMGYVRCKTVHVTDERVRMMNELLVCVKLIKMYAWEKSFAETISDIRKRERLLLEKAAYIQSISLAMSPTVPIVSAIFTFLAHIGAGYNLTAAQAMSVMAYSLGRIRASMTLLTFTVRSIVEGEESIKRLEGMSVMAYFLGRIRASMNQLRYTMRGIVEGQGSLKRLEVWSGGNMTKSTVVLTPQPGDDGVPLLCKAFSPTLHGTVLHHQVTLSVHCDIRNIPNVRCFSCSTVDLKFLQRIISKTRVAVVPVASMSVSGDEGPAQVLEGGTVIFTCRVKANPAAYNVTWFHNGRAVNRGTRAVSEGEATLRLVGVRPHMKGLYTCVASNEEGDGQSNALALHVQYAPVCVVGKQTEYIVERGGDVTLACNVLAQPPDVIFHWAIKNKSDTKVRKLVSVGREEGLTGQYTVRQVNESGQVQCWAKNTVGRQQTPCIFTLTPTGGGVTLSGCVISNNTASGFLVTCNTTSTTNHEAMFTLLVLTQSGEGKVSSIVSSKTTSGEWDEGMLSEQTQGQHLLQNITQSTPTFSVEGLEAGQEFSLVVRGADSEGVAAPVFLSAFTLKDNAQTVIGVPSGGDSRTPGGSTGAGMKVGGAGVGKLDEGGWVGGLVPPMMLSMVSALVSIIIIAIVVIIILKRRGRRARHIDTQLQQVKLSEDEDHIGTSSIHGAQDTPVGKQMHSENIDEGGGEGRTQGSEEVQKTVTPKESDLTIVDVPCVVEAGSGTVDSCSIGSRDAASLSSSRDPLLLGHVTTTGSVEGEIVSQVTPTILEVRHLGITTAAHPHALHQGVMVRHPTTIMSVPMGSKGVTAAPGITSTGVTGITYSGLDGTGVTGITYGVPRTGVSGISYTGLDMPVGHNMGISSIRVASPLRMPRPEGETLDSMTGINTHVGTMQSIGGTGTTISGIRGHVGTMPSMGGTGTIGRVGSVGGGTLINSGVGIMPGVIMMDAPGLMDTATSSASHQVFATPPPVGFRQDTAVVVTSAGTTESVSVL